MWWVYKCNIYMYMYIIFPSHAYTSVNIYIYMYSPTLPKWLLDDQIQKSCVVDSLGTARWMLPCSRGSLDGKWEETPPYLPVHSCLLVSVSFYFCVLSNLFLCRQQQGGASVTGGGDAVATAVVYYHSKRSHWSSSRNGLRTARAERNNAASRFPLHKDMWNCCR